MVKLSLALTALCATSAAAFAPQQGNQAFRCVVESMWHTTCQLFFDGAVTCAGGGKPKTAQ